MSSSASSGPAGSSNSGTPKRGTKRKHETVQVLPEESNETTQKLNQDVDPGDSDSDTDSNDQVQRETVHEVEVLSHAALRKLRKKAEKEAKLPKGASSHKPQEVAGDAVPKRQNSVWVGNLAFKTTEQALRAFFQRGVLGCRMTRVNLPTKTGKEVGGGKGMRGDNRGIKWWLTLLYRSFAYVDFATKEDQWKAVALSEQNLDGRKLLIKAGSDFTGRPAAISTTAESGIVTGLVTSAVGKSKTAQRILAAQKQPPAPTLFLGNLGFQATEESIRDMIQAHMRTRRKPGLTEDPKESQQQLEVSGEGGGDEKKEVTKDKSWLRKVRLGTFEDSGLCKGWAFVDFTSIENATAVLLDPRNHHLDGRKLVVEYASAEAVRRGGGPGAKAHRDKKEINENGKDKDKDKDKGRWVGEQSRGDEVKPKMSGTENLEGECGPPQKRSRRADEDVERERRRGKTRRTKPGAALALAQREKVAIVPSSGKKTVF